MRRLVVISLARSRGVQQSCANLIVSGYKKAIITRNQRPLTALPRHWLIKPEGQESTRCCRSTV
jgi:hypothetical protein